MSRRGQIQMTPEEIQKYLESNKTIIINSNGPGGFPHPMPMWFVLEPDGCVRMTTYRSSQKVKNIQRDPRVSLLAESGTEYSELRGAVLYANAEIIDDLETVIDTLVEASGMGGAEPDQLAKMRDAMKDRASKRVVIRIKPDRIVSWDHRKLAGKY